MNVLNLPHSLDITSVAGHTLSSEETHVVQNALLLLRNENNFKDIYFMGKLFGTERDYYIAFGYRLDAVVGRSFFYSNNQRDWYVLTEPSPSLLKLAPRVTQRFTGDPSHMINGKVAGDAFSVCGSEYLLKEEDRLAAVVYTLHEECAISPKEAFIQNVDGVMEINPLFQGLNLKQGTNSNSWILTQQKRQALPADSGDFKHSNEIEMDIWSFRVRAQGSVCIVLSLRWLGMTAYHRIRTSEHGFVYFGDGIKSTKEILPVNK